MSTSALSPMVTVVVLNWNNAPDTLECLASVAKLRYDNYDVIVVDNGSTDGSVDIIRDRHPDVTILENQDNLGYAEGNNVGIRYASDIGAEYVFVLNNDALVAPETLSSLVDAAMSHPNAGFLGPKVYHRETPQVIQSAGGMFNKYWESCYRGMDEVEQGQFEDLAEVDFVCGCAVLVSQRAIGQIGLLDPRFFLYREDIDWCYRATRAGFKVLYIPTAKAWHRSPHIRESESPRTTYYMTRNALLFLSKNDLGGIEIARVLIFRQLRRLFAWTFKPKWRYKRQDRNALWTGIVDFFQGKFGKQYIGGINEPTG